MDGLANVYHSNPRRPTAVNPLMGYTFRGCVLQYSGMCGQGFQPPDAASTVISGGLFSPIFLTPTTQKTTVKGTGATASAFTRHDTWDTQLSYYWPSNQPEMAD